MFGVFGGIAKAAISEQFENLKYIKKVEAPVFIVHGTKDDVIPHTQSIKLYGKLYIKVAPLIKIRADRRQGGAYHA